MNIVYIALLFIASYLFGSIPSGLLIGKIRGVDPRKYGSGNIGATNITRIFGFKYGAITFILDALKGMIIIGVLRILVFSGVNVDFLIYIRGIDILPVYGMCSILGHVFNIFLHFKGGKGVATSFGIFLVLSPWAAAGAIIGYVGTIFIFAIGSLSSLVGLLVADLAGVLEIIILSEKNFLKDIIYLIFFFVITVIILVSHVQNIKRLSKGKESKFNLGIPKMKEIHNHQKLIAVNINNYFRENYNLDGLKYKTLYLTNKKICLIYKIKVITLTQDLLDRLNNDNKEFMVNIHRQTKYNYYLNVDLIISDNLSDNPSLIIKE
ncbi:MAG: glycerol-3-phosphate 1-O-acyltransferase PlsY [Acholeplasmatales bacterium]|jgi:glycerol-3-phosphate acyltransferase PlsY|nr:glycerol-3-phosphate 1-O-acyltransferase PlsY [Acholeplasmatales bacterium]